MPEENPPSHLYHYTDIDALKAIIESKSLRFSSLERMDDPSEQKGFDIEYAGRFIFVSSWTAEDSESIPMWKLYGREGVPKVRIRLRVDPFLWRVEDPGEIARAFNAYLEIGEGFEQICSLVPVAEMLTLGVISPDCVHFNSNSPKSLLHKVEYVDDVGRLFPVMRAKDGHGEAIKLGRLGLFKKSNWEFQKEWRYRVTFIPLNMNQDPQDTLIEFYDLYDKIVRDVEIPIRDHLDIRISDSFLDEMEITTSPWFSAEDQTALHELIRASGYSITVKQSALVRYC